jgi:hypothetical protein
MPGTEKDWTVDFVYKINKYVFGDISWFYKIS